MNQKQLIYEQLAIKPTISLTSNFLGKLPDKVFENDKKMLEISRSLEAYNPKLKVWADNKEKELIAQAEEEARRIDEEAGETNGMKEMWGELSAERPEMTAHNPYLKRFLDRNTAKRLVVQRHEAALLAYEGGAWADLEGEDYANAVQGFKKKWAQDNRDIISHLDTREVADIIHGETDSGMDAFLQEKHLKDVSNRMIRRRTENYQTDISETMNYGIEFLKDERERNGIEYSFPHEDDYSESVARGSDIVKETGILANLLTLEEKYKAYGMTGKEAYDKTLETLRTMALNYNDYDDDDIIAVATAYMDEKNKRNPDDTESEIFMDKAEAEAWKKETLNLSMKQYAADSKQALLQDEINSEKVKKGIRDLFNKQGNNILKYTPNEWMTNVIDKFSDKPILKGTQFEKDGIPAEFASYVNSMYDAYSGTTTTERTGDQINKFNSLYKDIKLDKPYVDYAFLLKQADARDIHPTDFRILGELLDNQKSSGSGSGQSAKALQSISSIHAAIKLKGYSEMATLNFTDELDASVLEWVDDEVTRTGKYPTNTEIKDKAKLIYQDLQKSPVWLEKEQDLLNREQLNKRMLGYVEAANHSSEGITRDDANAILNDPKVYTSFKEELYKKTGMHVPDDSILLYLNYNIAKNIQFHDAELRKEMLTKEAELQMQQQQWAIAEEAVINYYKWRNQSPPNPNDVEFAIKAFQDMVTRIERNNLRGVDAAIRAYNDRVTYIEETNKERR